MTSSISYTINQDGSITISGIPTGIDVDETVSGINIFKHGATATTKPLNDNFIFLASQIHALNNNINFEVTGLKSYVNSTLTTYQDVNTLDTYGNIELTDGTINKITPTDDVYFVLPTIDETSAKFHQIYLMINANTRTLYAWYYNDGTDHLVYTSTSTIASDTKLYNANGTLYTGSDFTVANSGGDTYVVKYGENVTTYASGSNVSVVPVIDLGVDWSFQSRRPSITEAGKYSISYEYDGDNWVCQMSKRYEVS